MRKANICDMEERVTYALFPRSSRDGTRDGRRGSAKRLCVVEDGDDSEFHIQIHLATSSHLNLCDNN